jgi:hypothetical protein
MASLDFNDGTGPVTMRGVFGAPYDRFRNFSPSVLPIGPTVSPLTTKRPVQWVYNTIYPVTLELPYISPRVYNGESGTIRAQRLMRHLMGGGLVDVVVSDSVGTAPFANCWMLDGTTPSLTLESPQDGLYTLSVTLARGGNPFVAVYGGLVP